MPLVLAAPAPLEPGSAERVGQLGPNLYATPANQLLTPVGLQIELPGLRPQAIALSPNGELLAISGKTAELVVADPRTGEVLQRLSLPSVKSGEPALVNVWTQPR